MPKDKTRTHKKIEYIAKQEFLEKGFEKTSMREIAGKAGLAQSALYRHYESKEAMFTSLLDPFVEKILNKTEQHEAAAYENFDSTLNSESMIKDNAVKMFKDLMINHHDELKLIVCCSHGTKYENFIHDLVNAEVKETVKAFEYIRQKGIPVKEMSEDEIHVLFSAYVTAILEPVAHDWPVEKAVKCLDLVEEFFLPAWKQIMGFQKGK